MEIVEKGPLRIVGIEVLGEWEALWTEVPKAWRLLHERAAEIVGREDDVFVDVSVEKTGSRYRQVVGAVVESDAPVPHGMTAVDVPAQQYLHHRHEGPVQAIAESFGRIYAWARESGLRAGEFKLDVGYTQAGDETMHDLFVRIEPRAVATSPSDPHSKGGRTS